MLLLSSTKMSQMKSIVELLSTLVCSCVLSDSSSGSSTGRSSGNHTTAVRLSPFLTAEAKVQAKERSDNIKVTDAQIASIYNR